MKHPENTYLQNFKAWLMLKGHASTTARSYCRMAGDYIQWLETENIEPENANYNDILAYINYKKARGCKQRTQQVITNAIKQLYNSLQQEEQVTENPASNVLIKGIKRKELQEILSPEELDQIYKSYETNIDVETIIKEKKIHRMPPQRKNQLSRKRNKAMLGLIVYQGIKSEDLSRLEIQALKIREGKIHLQSSRRTAERILKLESQQIYELIDYLQETRKEIQTITKKESKKLFISTGQSESMHGTMQRLIKDIQAKHPKVKDFKQLRASVITNWLKVHNLRKVQYMAGHRYVSSTETYLQNNIEALQEDIRKYHPIG